MSPLPRLSSVVSSEQTCRIRFAHTNVRNGCRAKWAHSLGREIPMVCIFLSAAAMKDAG